MWDAGPRCQTDLFPGHRFEPGHSAQADDDLADELIIGFEEGVTRTANTMWHSTVQITMLAIMSNDAIVDK